MMIAIALVASIALAHLVPCQASSHYEAYETISRHVKGDNKLMAEKIYISLDSDDDTLKSTRDREAMSDIDLPPSTSTGSISNDEIISKRIKSLRPVKNGWSHKHNIIDNNDYDVNSPNSIMGHQSFARLSRLRPRTVESPALSVDTGQARSSSPSVRLANNIKKFFNVEEGHYSDIYDRIDKHKPLAKKKPAQELDERLGLVASRH